MAGAAIARAPSAPMGLHHGLDGREDRRGSLSANHAHANMTALEMQQAIAGGAKFARFRADVDVEQAERRRMQQQQNKADLERQIEEKNGVCSWVGLRACCCIGIPLDLGCQHLLRFIFAYLPLCSCAWVLQLENAWKRNNWRP